MTDEPDSIVLSYLRRLDDRTKRMEERLDDLSSELRSARTHMTGFMQDHQRHDEGIASLRVRMDRLERPLDLQDTAE